MANALDREPGRQRQNELVVALLHERLVGAALTDLGLPPKVEDKSTELSLTLLSLPVGEVERLAPRLADRLPEDRRPDLRYPLDTVLAVMYHEFEQRYGGWVPTMGKNRAILRGVAHNIGGGDEGPPVAASKQEYAAPKRRKSTGPAAVVGVADTRLFVHPSLAGTYYAPPSSLLTDRGEPRTQMNGQDYAAGHATFVAGLVLPEAPAARLEIRHVLSDDGTADSWEVAKKLVQLGRAGVHVLNMSFGCFTEDNMPPLVLATAVDRLDASIALVAAAGNHAGPKDRDRKRPLWPAALDDVVSVGATDRDGNMPEWSQRPSDAPWIDVLARGVDLVSTYLSGKVSIPPESRATSPGGTWPYFDQFAKWSGTSFAAARVSGAVAKRIRPGEVAPKSAVEQLLKELPRRQGLPWLA